jgi:transcriptional regulator with XRE-family HTH domain
LPKRNSTRHILAENLRRLRLENGLSQEKLGELAGLHRTYVGSIERAERNVSIDNIEALARALDVSVVALLDEGRRE